ncbi:branched-chain amino acid ABC transporter permease [Tistrella mobilis]|uniref:branched-chain amino acid ABC transporter permease n=1 Tax=Tistrella mobilis TaxID=171437 RepID=UPI0035577C4D
MHIGARASAPARGGRAALVLIVLLALAPLVAEAAGAGYLVSLTTRIAIWGLAAASLQLLIGGAGLPSLGHGAFVGIGAYAVGVAFHHAQGMDGALGFLAGAGADSLLVTLPAAAVAAALIALPIGAVSLRTGGAYFIMITLAFSQMLYFVTIAFADYGGEDGLSMWSRNTAAIGGLGLDTGDDLVFHWICVALLGLWLGIAHRISGSRYGLVLAAARDDERRLRALGRSPYGLRLAAFVTAAAVAGVAGALNANLIGFVSPTPLAWTTSGELMVMVVLGGAATPAGAVAGAAIMVVLEEMLGRWTEHWAAILGPMLVLAAIFNRGGVTGTLARAWSRIRRRGRP